MHSVVEFELSRHEAWHLSRGRRVPSLLARLSCLRRAGKLVHHPRLLHPVEVLMAFECVGTVEWVQYDEQQRDLVFCGAFLIVSCLLLRRSRVDVTPPEQASV